MRSLGAPYRHGAAESLLTRLAFAALLFHCVPWRIPFTAQPEPNGIARLLDLTFLANPAVMRPLIALLAASCLAYAAGRLIPFALGFMLLAIIGTRTLTNSQGAVNHTHQITALVALGLLAGYLWHARLERAGRLQSTFPGVGPHDLAFCLARQAITAAYVTAGVTKLLRSGGTWIFDTPNMALQIIKSNDQFAYSFLGDGAVGAMDRWASLIAANPNLARIFFGAGLLLELLAFLALAGRRAGAAFGCALLVMHRAVSYLMKLEFPDNEMALLIFFVGVPWLVAEAGARARERLG